jgi:hypothetical protein
MVSVEKRAGNGNVGSGTGRSGVETRDDSGLAADETFGVLANRRRRQVVAYLRDGDGTATVGALAEHVASAECDKPRERLTSAERKRVYVSLYQNHLPMMDDRGVVEYRDDRKTVRLRDAARELDPYLDGGDAAPSRAPVGAALAAAVAVALGGLRVGPLAAVPTAGWAALGALCLLGVATFELHAARSD